MPIPFAIKPAEPASERLAIAIIGPQASGKTTSALRLATGITQVTGGKILVIDTERKRALTYAKNFKFNHLELDSPYSPERYDQAFQYAEQNGFGEGDVIIIDSMSHEHEGPGGVLELHDTWLDEKAGQDYKKRDKMNLLAWNYAKKGRKRFIHFTLAQGKPHIILCFRAKEKVAMVKNDQNKTEVVNSGWQPIGGEEYFFEMKIAIVMPEGSFGKPDWNEKSARINEYGEGPLKNLLYNTEQVSEETGKRLAEICMAEGQRPKKELPPHAVKAQGLVSQIKTYTDVSQLYAYMTKPETETVLEEIKAANPDTHKYVVDFANERTGKIERGEL